MSLTRFKQKLSGKAMYFLVALVAVAIATWGFSFLFSQVRPNPKVLQVGNQEVYQDQLNRYYQFIRYQRLISQKGSLEPSQISDQAKQDLVTQYSLIDAMQQMSLSLTDAEAYAAIEFLPAFQKDGNFDPVVFRQFMSNSGIDADDLASMLKEQWIQAMTYDTVSSTQIMPAALVKPYADYHRETRDFSYIKIALDDAVNQPWYPRQALQQYYADHLSDYVTPLDYPVDYIIMSPDLYAKSLTPTERQLKELYVIKSEELLFPERFKLSQVIFKQSFGDSISELDWIRIEQMFAGEDSTLSTLRQQYQYDHQVVFEEERWFDVEDLPETLVQFFWENPNQVNLTKLNLTEQDLAADVTFWKKAGDGRKSLPSFRLLKPILEKEWIEINAMESFIEARQSMLSNQQYTSIEELSSILGADIQRDTYNENPFIKNLTLDQATMYDLSTPVEIEENHWLVYQLKTPEKPKQLAFSEVERRIFQNWLDNNHNQLSIDAINADRKINTITGLYRHTTPTAMIPKSVIDMVFLTPVGDSSWRLAADDEFLWALHVDASSISDIETLTTDFDSIFKDSWKQLEWIAYVEALKKGIYAYDVDEKYVINDGD